MRIIHAGPVFVPKEYATPALMQSQHCGRWVLNHAIAQKGVGMDAEVVAIAHKFPRDFACEIDGVKCHFLRTFHPYRHLTFFAIDQMRIARMVRRLKADIVHAHGTENAYALGAIRSGLPFCVTAQGLYLQIIPALGGKPRLTQRFLRASEHWALRRTKFAVAKSEYVRAALSGAYPHLDLTLIPNTYAPDLDCALAPKPGKHLAFVGSVEPRKGFHFVAEAMRFASAVRSGAVLHVIGNAPEGAGDPFENEQIASLRRTLGGGLVLHGKIASADVFKVLDGCRVLLAPSLEEMFGNQLIEGLMRGCFGIVAEGTALAENARRFGGCAVVAHGSAEALAAAVDEELSAEWQIARAEAARRNIRGYMAPSLVAEKHGALYGRVLGA